VAARCPARTRTTTKAGWLRCHGQDGHAGPHHISDRAWPPLRFTTCDCQQPDDVIAYYGSAPMSVPGGTRSAWPRPWKNPA
jgi:hypothetical protein